VNTAAAAARRRVAWSTAIDWALLLLVFALAARQLFVPPIVGMADQGDYVRVMGPLGLAHVGTSYEDTVFLWVQPTYRVAAVDMAPFLPSAELLFAGIARGLDGLVSSDGLFDLRLLGGVHVAAYLAAIWLLLRGARALPGPARVVAWLGTLAVAPDVACVAYLNSFYSEPAALVFLFATLGLALGEIAREAPSRSGLWAYSVCAALLASTKPQHYALAVPLAALPLALLASRHWRTRWTTVVPLSAGLMVLAALLFASLPAWQKHPARWHSVFHGVLAVSPSPAEDLAEFGLEPDLARFRLAYAIEVDGKQVPAPYMEVGGRFGFLDIARFYVRHPDRLGAVAAACARDAFVWREPRLGNYTRESGRPGSAHAPSYTGWSPFEDRAFPKRLWFLVVFFAVFGGVAAWELRRGLDTAAGRTAALCLTVAAMAVLAFLVVVVAGGVENVVIHLFLFQVLFDVCLFAGLAWVATRLPVRLPAQAGR
jgi:hypothetical protein